MKPARTNDLHCLMGQQSAALQEVLREAGYVKKDGRSVSTEGIRLVSQVARSRNLRDWPHTQTVEDYTALINAVAEHLHLNRET